jgi:hypothetical protein
MVKNIPKSSRLTDRRVAHAIAQKHDDILGSPSVGALRDLLLNKGLAAVDPVVLGEFSAV